MGESRSGERERREGDGRVANGHYSTFLLFRPGMVLCDGPSMSIKQCRKRNHEGGDQVPHARTISDRCRLWTSHGMHAYGMPGNVFGGDHNHPDWRTTGYDPSPAARSALWPSATPPRLPSRSDSHGVPESDIRTIYCTHPDNLRPQKFLTWPQRRQTPWQGRAAG